MDAEFKIEICHGVLSYPQLEELLKEIPLSVKTTSGRKLPTESSWKDFGKIKRDNPTILVVRYDSSLISLKPEPGKRIYDACFYGKTMKSFFPSRVLDESLRRNGESNSYCFNPRDLGLPYNLDMMLDIHKYGDKK